MVTGGRPAMVRRSVGCFQQQDHPHKELVILSDDPNDEPHLRTLEKSDPRIRVEVIEHDPRRRLGELRNVSMDLARGDWLVQWDDDDWYGRERISRQLAAAVDAGVGASALKYTLMHMVAVDKTRYSFRGDTGVATPGTILYRRSDLRYPNLAKNEDGEFLRAVRARFGLMIMGSEWSSLFVRIFHGANTWDEAHFRKRLRRTPRLWMEYQLVTRVCGDLTRHSRFRLRPDELATLAELVSYQFDETERGEHSIEVRT
ncbi:MAG: hypothetical protein RLZ19_1107 [Actinomycetota bacterium]|jgi:glycosyltransferase involved in cell wall biosynthesis